MIINRIKNYIQHPAVLPKVMLNHVAPLIKDDETFIRWKWKLSGMGYPLNLMHPKTFSEKLQWLKLHDRRPEYTIMVDKIKAKQWVAERIGEQYVIPTFGVWEKPEDIDFDQLPNQFVIKCNHNSGGVFICKDKSKIDKVKIIKGLRKGLKRNYFWQNREWPYKDVKPMILVEQYMTNNGEELKDYKFHCFNGIPLIILLCQDRNNGNGLKEDFFDAEWHHLSISRPQIPHSNYIPKQPKCFLEMMDLAKRLSKGYPFIRTDFYIVNDRVYFGEVTLFPASGMKPFEPREWDYKFGEWLKLPDS